MTFFKFTNLSPAKCNRSDINEHDLDHFFLQTQPLHLQSLQPQVSAVPHPLQPDGHAHYGLAAARPGHSVQLQGEQLQEVKSFPHPEAHFVRAVARHFSPRKERRK
eukprot:EC119766.1.p2 GENE.EC119766.1~~EC119766.1.p2  ORF type:complete len:106 (-),score=3.63 EC119766.1:78-395(-)